MTPKELGQILRAKRKEARLSAVQLGALLGCSDLVVKKNEYGERWPSIEFLRDFEILFSLTEGELSKYSNRHRIYRVSTSKKIPENNDNDLAQLRVKCGLTQKEVAIVFHISSTTFGAIEREEYNILSNKMIQIIPRIRKYLRNLALVKGKKE